MTSREQTLAFLLIGAVVLTVAGAGGYMFVWQPIQKQRAAEAVLTGEIADLEGQLNAQKQTAARLAVARVRSLPADEALAKREYTVALEHLLESAGVPKGYTISPKAVDNSARSVPELSKGKPVYTRVAYEITFKKADMWAIKDFLQGYYRTGLLQQITSITIKKDDDPGSKNASRRNDLTVTLTTEAILVDGAENRKTLLPVPTAFAAVGGVAAYRAVTVTPEFARGVVPQVLVPVLSPHNRDYSLMVQKDPFNGPLPPPPAFKMAKISDVKIKTDERPSPVKVALSGDGSYGATVTAIASGSLFAPGELKVVAGAIELPKTSATEGTSTVSVIATSADGKVTEKTSFKVSLEKPEENVVVSEPEKEDISTFVVLIGLVPRSDGTAWARISDTANRYRYQIDASPTGIKVAKEEIFNPRKGWTEVDEHKGLPAGVMVISAPNSKTNRTFKIIALDGDGLIVADLKPGGSTPAKPSGKGGWPPPGGKGGWPPAPVKQGPGNPMAALGGNMITAVAQPKYYRWAVGQSLATIKPIPEEEAKQILKQAEATGPVFESVAVVP